MSEKVINQGLAQYISHGHLQFSQQASGNAPVARMIANAYISRSPDLEEFTDYVALVHRVVEVPKLSEKEFCIKYQEDLTFADGNLVIKNRELPEDKFYQILDDCRHLNVKSIDIYGCANIIALDIHGLPYLQELKCSHSDITKLSLRELPSLQVLLCRGTCIDTLDLRGIPNLRHLCCSGTYVKNLDFSKTPNLERLDCSHLNFASLNVTMLTNLKNLDCSYCHIQTLNIRGLTNLHAVDCHNCASLQTVYQDGCTSIQTFNTLGCPNLAQGRKSAD